MTHGHWLADSVEQTESEGLCPWGCRALRASPARPDLGCCCSKLMTLPKKRSFRIFLFLGARVRSFWFYSLCCSGSLRFVLVCSHLVTYHSPHTTFPNSNLILVRGIMERLKQPWPRPLAQANIPFKSVEVCSVLWKFWRSVHVSYGRTWNWTRTRRWWKSFLAPLSLGKKQSVAPWPWST